MSFVFPVPSWRGRMPTISSSYLSEDRPTHRGVDIMYRRVASDGGPPGQHQLPNYSPRYFMPSGVPALAMGDGVVRQSTMTRTGGYVSIDYGGGWRSEYMHLRNLAVQPGQPVKAGQPVGEISFNPDDFHLIHLHMQMRRNGSLVDPEPLLRDLPVISMTETVPRKKRSTVGFVLLGVTALAAAGGYYYYSARHRRWAR